MPTLRRLFDRIAGSGGSLTKDKLHQFVEDAGVSDSFLMPKATLAAGAFMDKFDDGSGSIWRVSYRTK